MTSLYSRGMVCRLERMPMHGRTMLRGELFSLQTFTLLPFAQLAASTYHFLCKSRFADGQWRTAVTLCYDLATGLGSNECTSRQTTCLTLSLLESISCICFLSKIRLYVICRWFHLDVDLLKGVSPDLNIELTSIKFSPNLLTGSGH